MLIIWGMIYWYSRLFDHIQGISESRSRRGNGKAYLTARNIRLENIRYLAQSDSRLFFTGDTHSLLTCSKRLGKWGRFDMKSILRYIWSGRSCTFYAAFSYHATHVFNVVFGFSRGLFCGDELIELARLDPNHRPCDY